MPFFISSSRRSEAASSPAVIAMQPEAASRRHRSGVKASSNRILPHQEIIDPPFQQRERQGFQSGGWSGLVHEMKPSPTCFDDDSFDLPDGRSGVAS